MNYELQNLELEIETIQMKKCLPVILQIHDSL